MRRTSLVLIALLAPVGCADPEPDWIDANPVSELDAIDGCFDGEDNDNDGLVDCLDSDCAAECALENRPPLAPTVHIEPSAPTTRDDLVCSAEASDPDGDVVDHVFRWYRDGILVSEGAVLPAALTVGYDHWTCEALPTDGALEGTPAEAAVQVVADDQCTALAFDAGSVVAVPRFAGQDLVDTDFTLEAWVRLRSSHAGLTQPVITSDPQDDGSGWRFAITGPPGLRAITFQLGAGPDRAELTSLALVPEDRWAHVAVGYQAATGELTAWIDGSRVSTGVLGAAPSAGASAGDLGIGAEAGYPAVSLTGEVDEVRVSTVHRYGASDFAPRIWFEPDADTAGLWHFDEGAGNTAFDQALGRDGSLVGTSWSAGSACEALP